MVRQSQHLLITLLLAFWFLLIGISIYLQGSFQSQIMSKMEPDQRFDSALTEGSGDEADPEEGQGESTDPSEGDSFKDSR